MNRIPILFTFDEKLILPAGVCICSLLENALPETFYDIFIVHSSRFNLEDSNLKQLTLKYSNCNITYIPISGEFVGGYEIRGIPETCYYRLISPELLPQLDKIIYSDVDVIFREDMSRFYDMDLGTNCFGGVDNCSVFRPSMQEYIKRDLGLDWEKGYYYSGNLIINLKQIREEKLTDKFRELGRNNYNQQDMDIINIACNGRFLPIDPSFCLTNYLYNLIVNHREKMLTLFSDEQLVHALNHGIVHYNGAKPWNNKCMNQDIWWYYYRKSPYFDEKFCADFYDKQVYEIDRWTLLKRVKHVCRFFRK